MQNNPRRDEWGKKEGEKKGAWPTSWLDVQPKSLVGYAVNDGEPVGGKTSLTSPTSKDLDPLSGEAGVPAMLVHQDGQIPRVRVLMRGKCSVSRYVVGLGPPMRPVGRFAVVAYTALLACFTFALSYLFICALICSGCVPERDPASGCQLRSNQNRSSLASVRTWSSEEISEPSRWPLA